MCLYLKSRKVDKDVCVKEVFCDVVGDRKKTSSHFSQNALTFSLKHQDVLKKHQGLFLKPLDVFGWSSSKTRVGHAGRPTRFMPENERSSYYICSILFHVQNFRNFKLLDIERVSYEVPL